MIVDMALLVLACMLGLAVLWKILRAAWVCLVLLALWLLFRFGGDDASSVR